jgi:chemotaxis regulatin CheY-phosphate phosphatase CheZ
MANERASELMYDTASTLRLLDAELGELAPRRSNDAPQAAATAAAAAAIGATDRVLPLLPALFVRAMGEVHAMLASIRTGREHIRAAATERLAHTNEKLDEVSSATGKAALDIMDALDRAIAKVDELEAEDVVADADKGTAIRGELRDELFAVMGHMQFQDITSQQIMHVQSLLAEMEGRLTEIANLFDHQSGDTDVVHLAPALPQKTQKDAHSFDPNATLQDAETRQALADSLVERGPTGG